jgi:multidrug efflux pump subunit AcrB
MIALTGVVINDSIVLIDFINHRREAGMPLSEALREAGIRRFRPVILTSVTTVAGLTPMLLERSFQGQILVPMANSLAFGLLVATALILLLVPTMYSLYDRVVGLSYIDEDEDPNQDLSDRRSSLRLVNTSDQGRREIPPEVVAR